MNVLNAENNVIRAMIKQVGDANLNRLCPRCRDEGCGLQGAASEYRRPADGDGERPGKAGANTWFTPLTDV